MVNNNRAAQLQDFFKYHPILVGVARGVAYYECPLHGADVPLYELEDGILTRGDHYKIPD